MTLQSSFSSSDPLCLSEIKTEFSSISSNCLTGFYGVEAGVPTSGLICMADLLGKGQAFGVITVGESSVGDLGYINISGAQGNFGSFTQNAAEGHGAYQSVMWVSGYGDSGITYDASESTLEVYFVGWTDHPTNSSKNLLTTSSSFFYTGYTGFQLRDASGTVLWAPSATSTNTWQTHTQFSNRQVQNFLITNAQNAGTVTSGAGFSDGDTVYVFVTKNSAHIA